MKKTIRFLKRIKLKHTPYKTHYCCLCEHKIGGFLPYKGGWQSAPTLMSAIKMIGSDLDNFSCPVCHSHDRERHLLLYLQASNLLSAMKGAKILHFAPEQHLTQCIKAQHPNIYIKADLYPHKPDIQKVDLLNMPFENEEFDFLIANHVLEHVANLEEALKEINRVLKFGALAILQTPYASSLKNTWEDAGIVTEDQRLIAYGQEDHVRLFGQDIFSKIKNTGFSSLVKTHEQLLPKISAKYYGLNEVEPFMLFQKN